MKNLLTRARFHYRNERYARATTAARQVLLLDQDNVEALFYVAHGLYLAGQFRRSVQYWNRLKKIHPAEPCLHLNLGVCHANLGDSARAIQNYKKELELNPVSGPALYNLGVLYYHAHKYLLAAHYLERCYSQNHSVDSIVSKLAWSYFKTGQLEKEQLLYEGFLQAHPTDTWALNNLGALLMGQGAYARALLRLKKAAQIAPRDKSAAKNIRKAQRMLQRQHVA